MKRCSVCKQDLPLELFVKSSRERDGYSWLCRPCKMATQAARIERAAEWRSAPSEKRCVACGEVKPASDFHRNKWSKDGLKPACKPCNSARTRAYTEANRDKVLASRSASYRARIDEMKARDAARRERDKEKRAEQKRQYHLRNADRLRAKTIAWYHANLERARASGRQRQKDFPEKQWARNATRRARVRNAPVVEKVDRAAVIARDKGICQICHKPVPPKEIHLDHIVPLFQGGVHTADNLRVTHRLCNLSRKRAGAKLAAVQLSLRG